jgi:MFS family permease
MFRMLWSGWLTANVCLWMNDVASAWVMVTMTASPLWVALVQTASQLPIFLLGLPAGALADILDRRLYFMFSQIWAAAVALLLCVAILTDVMTPVILLVMVFANGVGLAIRAPVFAAIVPSLVPRAQLPAALALNSLAMNASRILGPLIAGLVIASLGSAYIFVLNVVMSVGAGLMIMRWRYERPSPPAGREHLVSAMRTGVRFVWGSARLKVVLARIALFFFHSAALMGMLPLVARTYMTVMRKPSPCCWHTWESGRLRPP